MEQICGKVLPLVYIKKELFIENMISSGYNISISCKRVNRVMKSYEFGNYIYEKRKICGLSQKALAEMLGVTDKAVSKWENGSAKPKSELIAKIAAALGVSSDELLRCGKKNLGSINFSEDSTVSPESIEFKYLNKEKVRNTNMNFIPEKSVVNHGYLCTWALQQDTADKLGITGEACAHQRDALSDKTLIKTEEFYHPYSREYRGDLYLLLDDGWDVPYGTANNIPENVSQPFGSIILDSEKFPDYGEEPKERLKNLSDKILALGYAGLGIWIATEMLGECRNNRQNAEIARPYWEERAKWCAYAGIKYWKIDWGMHSDREYREMMTQCARKYAPGLIVEHACCQAPFTPEGFLEKRQKISEELIPISDVFRLYDVKKPFKYVCMLERTHEALSAVRKPKYDTLGLLNGETCAYICAALGLCIGIMRYKREAEACIRWQRIAPPFSVYDSDYKASDEVLTDGFYFDVNPFWWYKCAGKYLEEKAPAVIARGCELPVVTARGGIKPFICASKNPVTGVYSIAAERRTVNPNSCIIAEADVKFAVGAPETMVGIFGVFGSLELSYSENIKNGAKVYAQDMLGNLAIDITEKCNICGNVLKIDGCDLRYYGKCARGDTETSEPSLIIKIVQ